MIFLNFLIIIAVLLAFAFFAGDINTFINIDSIVIVFIGFIFSSLAVSMGRIRVYLNGLIQIFKFSKVKEKSKEIKNMVSAVSIMTLVVGIGSTAQGLITASLLDLPDYSMKQIMSYASFTTVYALLFVGLVLIPVIFLNKD